MAWSENWYDKLSCKIIGWNYDVLRQCGEASYRTKNKYISALTIVSIIWSVIGYNFASKYLDIKSTFACLLVSLVFVMIVVSIERIIIMKQGNSKVMFAFRFLIAICMAILGSFIFDQILFATDLEAQIQRDRETEIKKTVALRMEECDKDIAKLTVNRDSLSKANSILYGKLKDNPTLETTSVSTRQIVAGKDSLGNPIMRTVSDVSRNHVANPLNKQVEDNNKAIQNIENRISELQARKIDTGEAVVKEIKNRKIGFMEDLAASMVVIFQNALTTIVYILLFIFMGALEMFVVSISFAEKKCEYDIVVEHQLQVKNMEIEASSKRLREKYLTKNID